MDLDALEKQIRNSDRAFPVVIEAGGDDDTVIANLGMSRRDYFAAAALTGLLANPNGYDTQRDTPERASRAAYLFADAMLAAGKVGP